MSIEERGNFGALGREEVRPVMILLADDDPQVRDLCTTALTREGLNVKVVPNGGEAWRALEEAEFDLIVTDNDMPGLTGLELIGKLRSACRTTPVVLISGTVTAEGLCRDARFPECAFLLKPFAPDRLLKLVKDFLASSRAKAAELPGSGTGGEAAP
jgi:DNA-binding NtrC family response regulator